MNHSLKLVAGVATLAVSLVSCARQEPHISFDSAEAAFGSLAEAIESDDGEAVRNLLGPNPEDLLSSGDAIQDQRDRARFVAAYRERHALVAMDGDTSTLVVGEERWPFAIPASRRDGRWYLDGEKGLDELVYRRIGANEIGAITVCRRFVQAQMEYAAQGHDGDAPGIYALKLISDEGMQNGLYWPTAKGAPPSPADEGVAAAAAEGYRAGARLPFHGYYFRMLYRQSDHAQGGVREYFKDGLLTQGFALVAWPATHHVSGAMTFIVNQDGVVYQRDLGEDTESIVAAMSSFDPDNSWARLDDSPGN